MKRKMTIVLLTVVFLDVDGMFKTDLNECFVSAKANAPVQSGSAPQLSCEDKNNAEKAIQNFEDFKKYALKVSSGSNENFSCALEYEKELVDHFLGIVKKIKPNSITIGLLTVLCFVYRCHDPYVADALYKDSLLQLMDDKKEESSNHALNIINVLFPDLAKPFRQYIKRNF